MNTAAAYIRVSTEDQTEYSPDSQLKAVRRYAAEHELILPGEFIFMDEGISGRKADKRPAFQRMIGTAKLKPKPFGTILLWKFSRFARNRQDSIVYKSMLRKQCGIDVVSVSEQLGGDNTSVLIEALIEAMDEYYSLNLAEEVRRGMNEKFSRGGVVSQPPFGYKMENGIFAPDNANAAAVQMIYSDYLSGMGIRQIAEKLNDMGIRSARGNLFENRTVEYILTNPTYTGKLRRSRNGRDPSDRFHLDAGNTVITEGSHQPIISAGTFEAVRQRLAGERKLYTGYSRRESASFMLKGLVRCGSCGAALTLSSRTSLQCHRYAKGACSVSHGISLKKINAAVIERLQTDFGQQGFEIAVGDRAPACTPPDVSVMIGRERKKLSRIREAYEAGVDSLEEYRENKQKIQSRIAELTAGAERTSPEQDTRERFTGRIKTGLAMLGCEETGEAVKNMALRSFVDRIIFRRPEDTVEIFYKLI